MFAGKDLSKLGGEMKTYDNKLEGVGAILFTEGGLPYQCVCCHLLHLQSTITS